MRKILLIGCLFITTGCSEFALLASAGSIGVSQNAYAKAYNGIDVLTLMSTEKSMKRHIYDKGKEIYDKRR
mgnify:FL=1|tara:strand:+ start:557 stop:769 length:213 start_codon:yes stop_codon:yes gene_type:complete